MNVNTWLLLKIKHSLDKSIANTQLHLLMKFSLEKLKKILVSKMASRKFIFPLKQTERSNEMMKDKSKCGISSNFKIPFSLYVWNMYVFIWVWTSVGGCLEVNICLFLRLSKSMFETGYITESGVHQSVPAGWLRN